MSVWVRINAQLELRENIRTSAKERRLTQRQLADGARIKFTRLTTCLNQPGWLTKDEVEAIARVLEMSVDELLGGSIFKGDPREQTFNFRPLAHGGAPLAEQAPPPAERKRAMCCVCGALRFWSTVGTSFVPDLEPQARMLRDLTCATCREVTRHALLKANDEYRDTAERSDYAPTRGEQTQRAVQDLIERITSFNGDVAFRVFGEGTKDVPPTVAYKWDESKSRWRFEINPCAPAAVQLSALREAWKDVASGQFEGVDWDPRRGVSIRPGASSWSTAVDDLIRDLQTRSAVERRRIADRTVREAFDAGQAE